MTGWKFCVEKEVVNCRGLVQAGEEEAEQERHWRVVEP